MADIWREVKREVHTTVGRRRTKAVSVPARVAPPAGAKGLVVSEVGDGWDVIERVDTSNKQV